MYKKYTIISLLILLFAGEMSIEQPANNTSVMEDNATAKVSAGPDLNYIWSITGIEPCLVSMVLNHDGKDIYGRAKYEPEGEKAWNADVIGSISDDKVELVLTTYEDKVQTTIKLSGIFANESIIGNFTQVGGGKLVNKGAFSAQWISPDTESYTPAIIEEPKVQTPEPEPVAATYFEDENKTAQKKSRFVDIHQYADKIGVGGDLSGVPPGMGGSGLS